MCLPPLIVRTLGTSRPGIDPSIADELSKSHPLSQPIKFSTQAKLAHDVGECLIPP